MTNQHLITPPRELVREWYGSEDCPDGANALANYLCTQAAQWGADQELEACVKWIEDCGYHPSVSEDFRAARRPKPLSLKEQALERLELAKKYVDVEPILRALEQLPDAL